MTREEAIKRIKAWDLDSDDREVLEVIIPELRESEDERIRKELIKVVSDIAGDWPFEKHEITKKEALAYLEKQKESLHIPETCKENANSFADGIIEVRSFQRGMEEGRKLERQKEQNGEDGFLEDELSAFLQNYDKEYDDDAAVSDVARHFYEIGKKQNEQKPHTDDEKEYIRTIKSIISDFIRDKKPENLAYYQRIYDWLDGRYVPFSCGQENGQPAEWAELRTEFNITEAFENGKKEVIDHPDKYGLTKQKPVDFPTTDEEVKEFLETHPKVEVPEKYKTPDFVFSKQEYESHPIISTDTTSVKPVELDGKALLHTADKSYQIGFRDGVASVKPVEWSEEDEKKITFLERLIRYNVPEGQYGWADGHKGGFISKSEAISKLKSLHPSWKPSEEQMEALDKARRFIPYNCDALESLYVDLKKL